MKSLVLRTRNLGSYVPLRTSSKRKRVANKLCLVSQLLIVTVQIDIENIYLNL